MGPIPRIYPESEKEDHLEEGEIREDSDDDEPRQTVRPLCSLYAKGACTKADKCSFRHCMDNHRGHYTMFDQRAGQHKMFDHHSVQNSASPAKNGRHHRAFQQSENDFFSERYEGWNNGPDSKPKPQVDRFGRELRHHTQYGEPSSEWGTTLPWHPGQHNLWSPTEMRSRSRARSRSHRRWSSRTMQRSRSRSPVSVRSYSHRTQSYNLPRSLSERQSRSPDTRSRSPFSPPPRSNQTCELYTQSRSRSRSPSSSRRHTESGGASSLRSHSPLRSLVKSAKRCSSRSRSPSTRPSKSARVCSSRSHPLSGSQRKSAICSRSRSSSASSVDSAPCPRLSRSRSGSACSSSSGSSSGSSSSSSSSGTNSDSDSDNQSSQHGPSRTAGKTGGSHAHQEGLDSEGQDHNVTREQLEKELEKVTQRLLAKKAAMAKK